MKKYLLLILLPTIILCGCSIGNMGNTPTKRVEDFLGQYQNLGDKVVKDIERVVKGEMSFSEEQKESYKNILKKHFQDLTYEIKKETIDGDQATVEVLIEVNDYYKANQEANDYLSSHATEFNDDNGKYDESLFNDYRIKLFKENKTRVKYTLYLTLHKNNSKWELDDLTNEQEEKILGTYAH